MLTGRATFVLDEETLEAPAGTVVFVRDPTVQREATADQAGTTVLAIGGKPDQVVRAVGLGGVLRGRALPRAAAYHEAARRSSRAAAEATSGQRGGRVLARAAGTPSPVSPRSRSPTRAGRSRSMRGSTSGRARTRISRRSTTACRRSFPAGRKPAKRIPDRDNPGLPRRSDTRKSGSPTATTPGFPRRSDTAEADPDRATPEAAPRRRRDRPSVADANGYCWWPTPRAARRASAAGRHPVGVEDGVEIAERR